MAKVTTRTRDGVTIVDVVGGLVSGGDDPGVRGAVRQALDGGATNIALNLGGVDFLNSSGINVLASSHAAVSDRGGTLKIPGVAEPVNDFTDFIAPIALALEQEQKVSEQIEDLARVARDERDYASEQFTHWFIKEQVEEVAKMSGLLQVAERERQNPMMLEYYIAREQPDAEEGADPTAPRVAGGGV